MRTLFPVILVGLMLAGCATTQTGTWVSDGSGGFCYQQSTACSYTGETPEANTTDKWWKFTGDVLDAATLGAQSTGRGVYPAK